MLQGTYLSSDEQNRSEAFAFGYRTIGQHPREVRKLIAGQWLVIDLDYILFDDKKEAIQLAQEAAERGLCVGIHTLNPDDERLEPLLANPNVVVRKTHRAVRAALRRQCRKQKVGDVRRPSIPLKQETTHVCIHPAETRTGS
jgi:hypothetical protein